MNPPEMSDQDYLKLLVRRRALQNRLFMGFSIVSTGVLICCCLPLMLVQYALEPTVTKKAEEVEAVARRIAPLAIPPGFTGTLARSADNSFVKAQVARFDQNDGRGRLLIGIGHWPAFAIQDPMRLQDVFDELFPGQRLLDIKKTTKKILMFRGQKVTIEIVDGEDRSTSVQYRQVTGKVTGENGAMQLLLQVESNYVTDEAINALLESLADKSASEPIKK